MISNDIIDYNIISNIYPIVIINRDRIVMILIIVIYPIVIIIIIWY